MGEEKGEDSFSVRLRSLIQAEIARGRTPAQLARAWKISETSLTRFLNSQRGLRPPTIAAVCAGLGIELRTIEDYLAAQPRPVLEEEARRKVREEADRLEATARELNRMAARLRATVNLHV